MTTQRAGEAFRDELPAGREFLRRVAYDRVAQEYPRVPAGGSDAVDLQLGRAVVALRFRDDDAARGFVARASRVPPGRDAAEPFVLSRALRLLGRELFRAVQAEGDGWFGALRAGLARPGDDVTLVCLSALQAVAVAHPLPGATTARIAELVGELTGPDPTSPVERVLAGSSHEPDVVLDVLRVTGELADVADGG